MKWMITATTVVLALLTLEGAHATEDSASSEPPTLPDICSRVRCASPPCDNPLPPPPGQCCQVCPDPPALICPRPRTPGICVELCSSDEDCDKRQKCCSNGCGHVCTVAISPKTKSPPTVDCSAVLCPRPSCINAIPPPPGKCCYTCPDPTEPPTLDCRVVFCLKPDCEHPLPPPPGQCCHTCPDPTEPPTLDCRVVFCPKPDCEHPLPPPPGQCCHTCPDHHYDEPPTEDCRFVLCAKPKCRVPVVLQPGKCCPVCPEPTDPPLVCPPNHPGSIDICLEECSIDEDCNEGEMCCFNGCGHVCTGPYRPRKKICVYNGQVYKVGESFPADDGCNTCSCSEGGRVLCTLRYCPPTPSPTPPPPVCKYGGQVYQVGDRFPAGDDCNTCFCRQGGRVVCTRKQCNHHYDEPPTEDCRVVLCAKPKCDVPVVLEPGKCCPVCPEPTDPPLVCPPNLPGSIGICVEECSIDEDCNEGEMCCSNGCGHVCTDPIPYRPRKKICVYNGQVYKVGETFPADDGCNTCSCSEGGRVLCTLRYCPPTPSPTPPPPVCKYGGQVYQVGDRFPAGDDCNTCFCRQGGRVVCTRKQCDHHYDEPPTEDCRVVLCAKPKCDVPVVLEPGKCCPVCPEPTDPPLVCPPNHPGSIGICVEECSIDEDCNEGEMCCSNGCGHVCTDPIPYRPRKKICVYNGQVYKVGESFPADDGCNTCSCSEGGRVLCTLRYCPPTPSPTPPPPVCKYGGQVYQVGDRFPAGDDCNTCFCRQGGRVVCTRKQCNHHYDEPPTEDCRVVLCAKPKCDVPVVLEPGKCCPVCPEELPTCPPHKPPVNCLVDPCYVTDCPTHPNATCTADYCGGCNARFFDSDGNEVTDTCEVQPPTCPPDKPMVYCFVDPCYVTDCPAHPDTTCTADYCGGCNARFYDSDGNEVTDTCECPVKGQVFTRCGSACPPNCTDPNPVCIEVCVPRCECPPGQVIDEVNNKCVPKDECPPQDICKLEPETGPCRAYFPSYFYNSTSGQCEIFIYGGCRGNGNRFTTAASCLKRCGQQCEIKGAEFQQCATCPATCKNPDLVCPAVCRPGCGCPPGQVIDEAKKQCVDRQECPDICKLPADTGPCKALIPAYFYNSTSGKCESFFYGGCQGNQNRFRTEEDCQDRCDPAAEPKCPPECSVEFCRHGRRKNRKALCSIPGPREVPGCTGSCQVTYCHACYFSEEPREPNPVCTFCGAPVTDLRCLKRWAHCVRSLDIAETPRDQQTEENFRCYRYPCPLRG